MHRKTRIEASLQGRRGKRNRIVAPAAENDAAIHFQGLYHRLGPHLGYDSNAFRDLLFIYFRRRVERMELSQPEGRAASSLLTSAWITAMRKE